MNPMPPSEWHEFLLFGKRAVKVATVRSDGRPHGAPVWFVLDGEGLLFMTGEDTVKGKNILRDSRVMLSIDDEHPPFAFVLIEGEAIASELPPAELLPWSTLFASRYMGAQQAEAYGKRNAVAGELLVRVALTKVVARAGIAD